METKPLVIRSSEVVDNFTFKGEDYRSGYARAFGGAWALLTDEQKLTLIEFSERRKAEQDNR